MDTWTDAEEKRVAFLWCVEDRSTRDIALKVDRSKSAVYRRIQKLQLQGYKGDPSAYETLFFPDRVESVVKPVVVPISPPTGVTSDRVDHVSIHWSDVHYPFQDDRAVDILMQIAHDISPSIVVDHGDSYDFWTLSPHRPPNERKLDYNQIDLQAQLNDTAEFLGTMLEIAQPERAIFMGGNHEDRWDRLMVDLKKDFRMRHLMNLDELNNLLDFGHISGIERMGYEYYPYTDHGDPVLLFNRLVLCHGDRTSRWVSRSMMEKYGKSVMFGHVHRIQNWTARNLKGQEAGWSIGCLCDINPHYLSYADWHQGFAVVEWSKDKDLGWLFDVHQIRIHEGKAVFRGRKYSA